MTRIDFFEVQFPVGQGGFHAGWLTEHGRSLGIAPFVGDPAFAWAYDCGSNQQDVLNEQIKAIAGARLDMLFLSHLDGDHVVGVDKLLSAVDAVDEVILPYLGDVEWALHLAAAAGNGSLSGTFIDLVSSPSDWFGARGVQRITYIDGHSEEDEGSDGPDPIDPTGSGEIVPDGSRGRLKYDWTRRLPSVAPAGSSDSAEIIRVPAGAVAPISGTCGQLNWVLSPFAFKPSAAKLASFEAALINEFGSGLTAKAYADAARAKAGRDKLRKCYDAVWVSHNLHSMALYAGPGFVPGYKLQCTARQGNLIRRVVQPGWLSTGDFDLSVTKRRKKFLQFYGRYAPMIGQLMLPHHGSDLSFDCSVLKAFPDLTFAIAAVGTNSHGHPGRGVQQAVQKAPGPSFLRVDESESSMLCLSGMVQR
ncbi:MBL fold metallo-hydrolase [Pseudogemmobacter humi]|uniref:Metallo-beta-lactamase domain-containing protein n=1 Tax=Pseudogemmobacter humi TaxID=2483812 RepID=A0A3P5XN94_9RHOB|nr:MBL fold metallo-hydrolase [Pseudogemmobacter humi]VDC32334.1 hypothetical protein XINFAN_03382 [Pseudogemmobacter humi]